MQRLRNAQRSLGPKASGFALKELLVLLGIGAVLTFLVGVFLSLRHPNPGAARVGCEMMLSNIGKALPLYQNSYNDQYPMLTAPAAWESTPTGTNRTNRSFDAKTPRAITALMWLLVRDDQPVAQFRCPGDEDAETGGNPKDPNGNFYMDFEQADHVSYSWQLPLADNTSPFGNTDPKSGPVPDPSLVIMADKAPTDVDLSTWNASVTGDGIEAFMSPNHRGECVNVLLVDGSVKSFKRPDCGYKDDYIYTASGSAKGGARYGGRPTQAAHKSINDSALIGPK